MQDIKYLLIDYKSGHKIYNYYVRVPRGIFNSPEVKLFEGKKIV